MKARTTRRYVGTSVAVVLVALGWLFMAPSSLWGSTTYVVVTGNSMEPLLHADDLAVVREKDDYGVGDVVAYESEKIDQMVLHRIVEREGDRFVLQGDNNDFLDPEKPTEAQLSGELWVHAPKVGSIFRLARTPVGLAVGVVIIMFMLGLFSSKKRRERHGRHSARSRTPSTADPASDRIHPPSTGRPPPPPPPRDSSRDEIAPSDGGPSRSRGRRVTQLVASVSAAFVVVFGVLGAAAATRTSTLTDTDEVSFEHSGTFAYSASALNSPAYDGPTVTTGEPVFLKVIDELKVTFTYRFVSDAPHDITSEGTLTARLGAGNGLRRTIELPTETEAEGDDLIVSSALDLDNIKSLVRDIEDATGVDQTVYTITLTPEIGVSGSLAGQTLNESFTPELDLEYDGFQLQTSVHEEGKKDPALTPTQPGSVAVTSLEPNPFTVSGRTMSIALAERIALYGGGVALLVLIGAVVMLMVSRPKDEPARIEARYGSSLIPVTEVPLHADAVEVSDFPTLIRLADQYEQAILYQRRSGTHTYMLPQDGILYRYQTSEGGPGTVKKGALDRQAQMAGRGSRRGSSSSKPPAPPRDDNP